MKTFYSQSVVLLCSEPPELETLRQVLESRGRRIDEENQGEAAFPQMEGPSLRIPWDVHSGSACVVDVVSTAWPDDMGCNDAAPGLVANAHALGGYGPCVNPGALERAISLRGLPEFSEGIAGHAAFVRLRTTGPMLRPETEAGAVSAAAPTPAEELRWLLDLALELSPVPGAIAFFNPNGESLLAFDELRELIEDDQQKGTFPVQAAISVRAYAVAENWSVADSVGMGQFDLPDHGMAIHRSEVPPGQFRLFMLNLCLYQISKGAVIRAHHTTTGPDDATWRAEGRQISCAAPVRRVLHWIREGAPVEPEVLARRPGDEPEEEEHDSASQSDGTGDPSLEEVVGKVYGAAANLLAQHDTIRQKAAKWIASPAFQSQYYDDVHAPLAFKLVYEREVGKKEAGKFWKQAEIFGIQSPELWTQYQKLATHGRLVFAAGVIVNPMFRSKPDESLPCTVVVAEEQSAEELAASTYMASYVAMLYSGEMDTSQYPKTTARIRDDQFRLFHRDVLPPEENGGHRATLLSVQLRKNWMPPEDFPFIPLMMEPGPKGAVVQVPWHIAAGTPPPVGPPKEPKWAGFAEMDREADRILAEHNAKAKGSFIGRWFRRLVALIFFSGLVMGVASLLTEKKPVSIKPRVMIVPSSAYHPLKRADGKGMGFVAQGEEGMLIGASGGHGAAGLPPRPDRLVGADGLEVSLGKEWDSKLEGIYAQAVTTMTKETPCLTYSRNTLLGPGDTVRVLLPGGASLTSTVAGIDKAVWLHEGSLRLVLDLKEPANLDGMQGCPVVHSESNKVVGVLLGAGRDKPQTMDVQTLSIAPPSDGSKSRKN